MVIHNLCRHFKVGSIPPTKPRRSEVRKSGAITTVIGQPKSQCGVSAGLMAKRPPTVGTLPVKGEKGMDIVWRDNEN